MIKAFNAWLRKVGLTLFLLAVSCFSVFGQSQIITISQRDLANQGSINLSSYMWQYHIGDNPQWADSNYDDANWEPAYTIMKSGGMLDTHWSGIGWFRLHIYIDSTVTQLPIGLNFEDKGASEIYINGKLIKRIGIVSSDKKDEHPKINIPPFITSMQPGKDYVIAVRYSNHQYYNFLSSNYFDQANIYKGFTLSLGSFDIMYSNILEMQHHYFFYMLLLLGIAIGIFFIHLIMYIYYPDQKSNLFYGLTIGCFSIIIFSELQLNLTHSLHYYIVVLIIDLISFIWMGLLLLRFTYSLTKRTIPLHFYFLTAIGTILSVLTVFFVIRIRVIASIFLLINLAEAARILIIYFYQNRKGSVIIAVGFFTTIVLAGYQMLLNIGIINPIWEINGPLIAYYGILGTIIAMSIYLARVIANTNYNLKQKLSEVERLSGINRENDKRQAELLLSTERERAKSKEATLRAEAAELNLKVQEAESKALEAEHRRKTEELEEARKLQLSMLPEELPDINRIQLAVHMETATEVGGDYYDFYQVDDNEFTLAVGDATGHGLKAGTLVTAVKSLFPNIAEKEDIISVFHTYTKTIRRMNLGILYMALVMAKFKSLSDDKGKALFQLTISSAGMPPVLLYRAAEQTTHTILLKGMPLGTVPDFPYVQNKYELHENDVLLFMSDGFMELLNPQKEMIGMERTKDIFTEVAGQTPAKIIEHLNSTASDWKKDMLTRDDITFVVVKVG